MMKPQIHAPARFCAWLLVVACTPGTSADTAVTQPDIGESGGTTASFATGTGEPTTTSGDPTTAATDEEPCAACGPGEACVWLGADDHCGYIEAPVECRPVPDGCSHDDLCGDLACTVEFCGTYECSKGIDWCELGVGMVNCGSERSCDVLDPGQCSVDGTTCLPISRDEDPWWDAAKCVPTAQPGVAVGGPCTLTGDDSWQWGDCEAGAICHWIDPDTLQGVCEPLCVRGDDGVPTCTAPDTACVDHSTQDVEIRLCQPTCDPLDPLACPAGDACIESADAFVCIREFSGDAGAMFDACEYVNTCDPGLLCLEPIAGCDLAASGCCLPYCDLEQPMCPDDLTCAPYFPADEAPPGHEDVGYCHA